MANKPYPDIPLSVAQMTRLFSCTKTYIKELQDLGIVEKMSFNQYRGLESAENYIAYLKTKQVRAKTENIDYSEAKARKEMALAELAEIDVQKARGELIEVSRVGEPLDDIIVKIRSQLMTLEDLLPPQLSTDVDEQNRIKKLINVEVVTVLLLLSKFTSDGDNEDTESE